MAHHYERTELRQQQIAVAALEVIAERGLGGFTTRAIAERVGITDGTLFRHFKNKAEIVWAAMGVVEDHLFATPPDSTLTALEQLEAFFRHRASLIGGSHAIGRLIFSEQLAMVAGERGRERVAGWRQRNSVFLNDCIAEIRAGRPGPWLLTTPDLAPLVYGALLTFFLQRTTTGRALPDLDTKISHSWHILTTLIEAQS